MSHKPRDKYSKAIRYFRSHPDEIIDAWYSPYSHRHGCLFIYACKFPNEIYAPDTGCLTMVKSQPNTYRVPNRPDLTSQILADKNIPSEARHITLDALKHFAKWQRRLDKELNRV